GFLVIGLVANMWVVAGIFIILTATNLGTSSATNQYELDFLKNSKSKATLLSVNQLIYQFISGAFGLVMGFMVAEYSFSGAYFITGGVLLGIVIIALFYIKESYKQ